MRIHESESKGQTEEKKHVLFSCPKSELFKKGDNKISRSLNGLSLSTEISENKKENKIVISAL